MSKISDYLLEVVKAKKKGLASRIAKRVGSATFKELSILLQSFKISNDSNRDVELEEKDRIIEIDITRGNISKQNNENTCINYE